VALLDEIGTELQALGCGTLATDIFLGLMPASPDACGVVHEYPGEAPELGFGVDGLQWEHPRLQVVFRGAAGDYAGPRAKAETAFVGLAKVQDKLLSGTRYLLVEPLQSPFLLKRDDRERVHIAFNVSVWKEPS
jgi:hypothetical protein